MSSFTFNGVSSDTLGLILPETPFRPSWAEETEEIVIPGRSEVIKRPNGIYSNQEFTVNAVISDKSKIQDIYSTLTGTGKLILSTAPNEYMNVRVEPLIPQGVALSMAELPITFDCFPFAYAITPSATEISTSYTEVENTSSIYSAPIIEIQLSKNTAPILKGDVNFDGIIDSVDASLVLAEIARLAAGEPPTFTPEQVEAADVNDDGIVDVVDASLILQLAAEQAEASNEDIAEYVTIDTNGAELFVGIPNAVISNGFKVTIDCGLYLIYYTDTEGNKVNIMNYSSYDLPLLHTGTNYMKYSGENVSKVDVIINERWL